MKSAAGNLDAIAERALQFVADGSVVGLGSGHASTAFIHVLGERVRTGLKVRGIPTSQASADLATQLGIPLTSFDEIDQIDIDFDGADEVDPACNLIKGYGGALVREKIVAAASKKLVILVGEEKLVPVLGSRGKLPVEVVPFGLAVCKRRLIDLGYESVLRQQGGKTFVTDNGNVILDCQILRLDDPMKVEQSLLSIPGVVGTGLFLNMANVILIGRDGTVEMCER